MNSRGRYADPQDVVDLVHIERALKARGVEDVDEGVLWAVADLAHRACAPASASSPAGPLTGAPAQMRLLACATRSMQSAE